MLFVVWLLFSVKWEVTPSVVKGVIEERDAMLEFVDSRSGLRIATPIVGPDGMIYDIDTTLEELKTTIKFYGSLNPKDENYRIDSITGDELKDPVVGSDGYLYGHQTAMEIMKNRHRGLGGQLLTGIYDCPFQKWRRVRTIAV
jgi:hypothetical protein